MAELEEPKESGTEQKNNARGKDEVALELMKFIAVSTGYGKTSQSGAGFSGKPNARTPEEHVEALLELYGRCKKAVG